MPIIKKQVGGGESVHYSREDNIQMVIGTFGASNCLGNGSIEQAGGDADPKVLQWPEKDYSINGNAAKPVPDIVYRSNEDNRLGNLYFGEANFYYSRDHETGEIITLADSGEPAFHPERK
jgi:hypothetical protein